MMMDIPKKNYLRNDYQARINRVQDYIEAHLSEEFSVESLAQIAHFSPYHFHRLFSTFAGETLFQYISRVRMEKAAFLLLADPSRYITEIAISCGFSSQAVFNRAFKKHFGASPGKYRETRLATDSKESKSQSKSEQEFSEISLYNQVITGQQSGAQQTEIITAQSICVQNFNPMFVAYIRHTGPYKQNVNLFSSLFLKLYRWADARDLTGQEDARWLCVYHSDPEVTREDHLRISVCLTVPENTRAEGEFNTMIIPGGKYAIGRFLLESHQYQQAWNHMFGSWLPESGYQPDDRNSMEFYPLQQCQQEQGKQMVDIIIPVKPL